MPAKKEKKRETEERGDYTIRTFEANFPLLDATKEEAKKVAEEKGGEVIP